MPADEPIAARQGAPALGDDGDSGEAFDTDEAVDTGDSGDTGDTDGGPLSGEDITGVVWERPDWIALAVILVAAVLLVGLHVRTYTTLSPIDELQHVDYTIRASHFDIPRVGELVEFEAMSEAACRTVDANGYVAPPCGLAEYDHVDFQERGFNTAAKQLPPYYLATGLPSRAAVELGLIGSPVTAARMMGAIWLAAACALIWYMMAMLRIPRLQRAPVVAILMVTPLVVFHSSTVNPDSILLFTGSITLLATLKYEQGRLRWWWLLATYALMFFVEATNILAISACSVYLMVCGLQRRQLGAAALAKTLAVPVAAIAMAGLLRLEIGDWLRLRWFEPVPKALRAGTATMFEGRDPATFEWSWSQVIDQLDATFLPIRWAYLPPFIRESSTVAFMQLSNWLLIGLLFAVAFVKCESARATWLARVVIPVLLLAGPFYTFYYAHFSSVFYAAPGRFGLPLLPLVVVAAAAGLTTRASRIVAVGVGGAAALNTLVLLVI